MTRATTGRHVFSFEGGEQLTKELSTIPKEMLIKVLTAIYRSIQRRTSGGKEYLQFTKQYVGARVGRMQARK